MQLTGVADDRRRELSHSFEDILAEALLVCQRPRLIQAAVDASAHVFREACPHDFSLERVKALAAASLEYIRSSRGPTTRLASMLTAAEALILLGAAQHDRCGKVT